MVKQEYAFDDISNYLLSSVDLLIAGEIYDESRCKYFFELWKIYKKPILILKTNEQNILHCSYLDEEKNVSDKDGDVSILLPRMLSNLSVSRKCVLVDITSLDHISIMALTHVLIKQTKPKKFFASYISPLKYLGDKNDYFNNLSFKISEEFMSVPGFARIEKPSESVCAFIGFEGSRFKNMMEFIKDEKKIFPIISFPSNNPYWFNIAIWDSMDTIKSFLSENITYKCSAESIFDAVNLLERIFDVNENIVLIPLGTRPHSMSCAIFASQHKNVRIVYDYAIENTKRSEGIANKNIYNLTNFIET
jgi:hypothetical protein